MIKTGCGPYLIDWISRGILTGIAMNGSAAIHDLELAIGGQTSEDVGPRLDNGTFGFGKETMELPWPSDAHRLPNTQCLGRAAYGWSLAQSGQRGDLARGISQGRIDGP